MRAAWILLPLTFIAGCFGVEPPDGAYLCATGDRPCPSGYDCVAGYCTRAGVEVDLAAPGPDLAAPPDLATPDLVTVLKPDLSLPYREVCVLAQSGSAVVAHRSTADGNTTPLRSISGVSTLLSAPTGIAADLANREIFVANPGTHRVLVFSASASGDAAPVRYIDNIGTPMSVAVNPVDNELYVVNRGSKRIEVYGRAASGVAPVPKRTLDLSLTSPMAVAYDHANHELVVTDVAAPYAVGVWDSLATGTPLPKRLITGAATLLSIPNAVGLNPTSAEIYVANNGANSVTVFSHAAIGNAAPSRTITGLSTGLNRPNGVVIDTAAGLLLVANNAGGNAGSLAFFELGATGNRAPLRQITGTTTLLLGPFGVTYCSN